MSSHPWFILGAGSIGCLWAAQLHRAFACSPTLIVRNRELYASKSSILTLTHTDSTESRHPVNITTASELNTPIHQLVVCTKAGDALNAMQSIKPSLAKNCDVLLLQNGMGSQQAISEAFPDLNIRIGSTTDGAWIKEPLHICHAGQGQTLVGSFDQRPVDELLNKLHALPLKLVGSDNIEDVLWKKLAVNCAINGLTALFDCQNGQLLDADKQPLMDQLINEFIQVSHELNQPVSDQLHEHIYSICRITAENHSSTCMDVRLQRKTELAFINGYLLDLAQKEGLSLPAHEQLMDQLSRKGVRW